MNKVDGSQGKHKSIERYMFFFSNIYASSNCHDLEECLSAFPKLITPELNVELIKPVTKEEIKEATFALGGMKAPSPDRLNGLFYQKHWETIGKDVVADVTLFFHSGQIPSSTNETVVTLAPKIDSPESLTHFRPISCCNFSYKIMLRILVTCLKPSMNSIITP